MPTSSPASRPRRSADRAVAALIRAALAAVALGLAGCSALPRNAVPVELMGVASLVPDVPGARAPAGLPDAAMQRDLARSFEQESATEFPVGPDGVVHYAHLALSGGGANGAFGAGFLVGWSQAGKRPLFKIVTGVSTGALMAPFVFAGPDYDAALTEFYTQTSSANIFRMLSIIPQLLGGESLADSGPLESMIERQVDAELLRRIAAAHERRAAAVHRHDRPRLAAPLGLEHGADRGQRHGRRRLGSSGRSCWRRQRCRSRFRRCSSRSRPGGGATTRCTSTAASGPGCSSPAASSVSAPRVPAPVAGRAARSSTSSTTASCCPRRGRRRGRCAASRCARSRRRASRRSSATCSASTRSTLREQAGYNWITIPEDVELWGSELFDPVKMGELFELGRQRARAASPWFTDPPGLRWDSAP